MTIKQARKILGKNNIRYSDEMILNLMEKMEKMALLCIEKIDNQKQNHVKISKI